MNSPHPVNLQDPRIKARPSSIRTGRKVMIGMLVVMIAAVMIAWFGFLGWGMVEIIRGLASCLKKLWTLI
jgi:hypothetical protein